MTAGEVRTLRQAYPAVALWADSRGQEADACTQFVNLFIHDFQTDLSVAALCASVREVRPNARPKTRTDAIRVLADAAWESSDIKARFTAVYNAAADESSDTAVWLKSLGTQVERYRKALKSVADLAGQASLQLDRARFDYHSLAQDAIAADTAKAVLEATLENRPLATRSVPELDAAMKSILDGTNTEVWYSHYTIARLIETPELTALVSV